MRLIFFGSSKFVIPILETLHNNYSLVLVVTTEKLSTEPVIKYCIANNVSYLSVSTLNDSTIPYTLNAKRCPLAVLAYFGLILPKQILDIFSMGILNIHPSLLPKYRGPTPVQTAILNGDKTTGVTLIKLDEQIDHGPILAQIEEKILLSDTAETLYARLFKIGAKLLEQNINKYINPDSIGIKRQIKLSPQNESKATFTRPLTRQDGYISPNNPPSPTTLNLMIRAYYPWPGAWTTLRVKGKGVRVKFLPENKLQVEGGKPMIIKDFINGYPEMRKTLEGLLNQ